MTSSSSPGSSPRLGGVGPAALLLLSEAAWGTLVVGALANGTAGPHRPKLDLPYLAFALPALAALVIVSLGRGRPGADRSGPRRWARRLAVAAAVVLGVALSAGLVASSSSSGTTWAVAFHPWTLPAHHLLASRAARWGWGIAILGWARGSWAALAPPSLRQSATSLLLGALVFLFVFAHQIGASSTGFRRATGDAGWLLFVYFPVGGTAAAWAHERGVERRALRTSGTAPSGAWLAVLTLPLAVVAVVALAVGGAATVVGPAAARVGRLIGSGLSAAGDWVFSHLPQISPPRGKALKLTLPKTRLGHRHAPLASSHPSALGIALLCLLCLLLLGLLALGVRASVRWARRLRRRREVEVDEERESVFSWGHLGDQVRRALLGLSTWLVGLLRRTRRADATVPPGTAPQAHGHADPVRSAYRRLLSAASSAQRGRTSSETPRELARRLTSLPELERLGTPELRSLTAAYEGVRYAGLDAEPYADRAASDAEVLARALVGATPRTGVASGQPAPERDPGPRPSPPSR